MANEANADVVRRMYDAISNYQPEVIEDIIAANWVNHDSSLPPMEGPAGARQLIEIFHMAFPDFRIAVDDLVSDGDRVAVRTTCTGTHQGDFLGIPATGRHVEVQQMAIHRVIDGKVTDNWVVFDALGLMQQLGIIPAPGAPVAAG